MNSLDAVLLMSAFAARLVRAGLVKDDEAALAEVNKVGDLIAIGFEHGDLMYSDYELGQKDCLVGKPARGGMSSAYERGYENQNQLQVRAS